MRLDRHHRIARALSAGSRDRADDHPLVEVVRGALPRAVARSAGPFLDLLGNRLAALREVATGRASAIAPSRRDRACVRRFLAPLEGSWHDGDENLVRGFLDRWTRRGEDPRRAVAGGLVRAADELARVRPRPETLWFFLWEMESTLEGLASPPKPRARIRSVRARTPGRS